MLRFVCDEALFDFVQHVLQTSVQGDEMSVGQDRAEGVSTQYRLHHPAQHTLPQQQQPFVGRDAYTVMVRANTVKPNSVNTNTVMMCANTVKPNSVNTNTVMVRATL